MFVELRNEFREQNRQRIREMLRKDSLVRYRKDGMVAGRLETGLMTTSTGDWRSVKDYLSSGGTIPEFSDDFRIAIGRGLDKELRDLTRDADLISKSDKVARPESEVERGILPSLADDDVLQFMDQHIHRKEPDGKAAATDEGED